MEEPTSPTSTQAARRDELVQTLDRQRSRVEAFLSAHRQRLHAAEANLAARIGQLTEELAKTRTRAQQAEATLGGGSESRIDEAQGLERIKEEFEAAVDRASTRQRQLADEIQQRQETLESRIKELADRQMQAAETEASLLHQREAISLEQERVENEVRQLEQEKNDLARRRAEIEQLAVESSRPLEQREEIAPASSEEEGEYQRRYEMALEDLRELRAENEELRRQATQPRPADVAPTGGETLDWETQKRRLLASLEAEFDENDEEDARERLKIEEVIETTNRIVADRDREILELKQLLQEQSGQVGAVAVGAAAFGEMLDQDAIIQEERENLKQLQKELEEKLRKAEVEISIQRAKLARREVEIEEKMRLAGHGQTTEEKLPPSDLDKPTRGRWLSRLGLKDGEES